MESRSELLANYSTFSDRVKTQFDAPVRVLRIDLAKEYMSELF